jgi:hypothetical protein
MRFNDPVRRALPLLLVPAAALLLAGCGGGGGKHVLTVGAVEDAAKWSNPTAQMSYATDAGFRAIVLSSVWKPPRTQPTPLELTALRGAVDAAVAAGITPIVAVYQLSGDTPLTAEARTQFAAYAASIPRALPDVRTVIVGNEPNLPLFWQPQFTPSGADAAAPAYLELLAQTYDALKQVDNHITVIGGGLSARGGDRPGAARATHSPTRFIEDLGAAYKASGRREPVMDMFSIHPYPENSSIPPTFAHPHVTSIGIADYGKLVGLLDAAFPGQELPVVYGEYGLETTVPPGERSAYTGVQPAAVDPISAARQGREYAEAIRLAACQPRVRMLLFFHVVDESALSGLQTGVYYADDVPKASVTPVSAAADEAWYGRIQCSS